MNFSSFDGFFADLNSASNEAIDILLSSFNLSTGSPSPSGGELFFGKLEGFNSSHFSQTARGELNAAWYTIRGFFAAIDWTEPWIIGLCLFHMFILMIAIFTRKYNSFQIALFCIITATVYIAESVNSVLAQNWKIFSRQNYFDKRGVFISAMWSTPLILVAIVMLAQSLYSASTLLVQVKRKQLIHRAREINKDSKKSD